VPGGVVRSSAGRGASDSAAPEQLTTQTPQPMQRYRFTA